MVKKVKPDSVEQYLKEASSWDEDRIQTSEKNARFWKRFGIGGGALAGVAILAAASLFPLKSTEPFVIRVNQSTGQVDIIKALKNGKSNYDEAVNKYFIQKYVSYRENYSPELAEDYYYNVGIMSDASEQQRYFAFFNPANPSSPLNVYGQTAKAKIEIQSVSFINEKVALVRYKKEVSRGGVNTAPQVSYWAATVTFSYNSAPMSEKDRAINPLGFQVSDYRNDPDSQVSGGGQPVAITLPTQPAPAASAVAVMPTAE